MDSTLDLITISRELGGPDLKNISLYRDQKYGIKKNKIHNFETLVSDPVFSDVVSWIKTNFNKSTILKLNHTVNYKNITSDSQILHYDFDLANLVPDIAWIESHIKGITELKHENEEIDIYYQEEVNRSKLLDQNERTLLLQVEMLEKELFEVDEAIILAENDMKKLAFSSKTSYDSLRISMEDFRLQITSSIPYQIPTESANYLRFSPSRFFKYFFEKLFIPYQSNIKWARDLCLIINESNEKFTNLFSEPLDQIYSEKSQKNFAISLFSLFNLIETTSQVLPKIHQYSKTYAGLMSDVHKLLYLNGILDYSLSLVDYYRNLGSEELLNIMKTQAGETLAASYFEVEGDCFRVQTHLNKAFFNVCILDAVIQWKHQMKSILQKVENTVYHFEKFLLHSRKIDKLCHKNMELSNSLLLDLLSMENMISSLIQPLNLTIHDSHTPDSGIFLLLSNFLYALSNKKIKLQTSHKSNLPSEILKSWISPLNSDMETYFRTYDKAKSCIDQFQNLLLSIIDVKTNSEKSTEPTISIYSKKFYDIKTDFEKSLNAFHFDFQSFISDFDLKKEDYDENSRKVQEDRLIKLIPKKSNLNSYSS